MNKRFHQVSLAVAMLSAASTPGLAATSRVRCDDYTGKGLSKLTAEGDTTEVGAKKLDDAVDTSTSVVGMGASTEEQAQQSQQTQTAKAAPQAGTSDVKAAESEPVGEAKAAVGEPAAGGDQQT